MNSFAKRSIFALTSLFTCLAAAPAQTANWSLNYGLADFGGSITASLYSRRNTLILNTMELSTGASLIQRIRMFGQSVETNAVLANYTVRRVTDPRSGVYTESKTGSFVRRICGLTWSTSTTYNTAITATCDPGRAFGSAGVSSNVDVFGYVVGVRANADVGLNYSLTPNLVLPTQIVLGPREQPPALSVGLTGYARGSANGTASAWLAVPILVATVSAGVTTNMVFARTRADLNASAALTVSGVTHSGDLTINVDPIAIAMSAFARVSSLLGTVSHTQTIVNWSAGSRRVTIPIQ